MKAVVKDRSIQRSIEGELGAILRSFETWIGEAAAAAWSIWDADATERVSWALEQFSNALTQSGGLVPVAKKYVRLIQGLTRLFNHFLKETAKHHRGI